MNIVMGSLGIVCLGLAGYFGLALAGPLSPAPIQGVIGGLLPGVLGAVGGALFMAIAVNNLVYGRRQRI